VYGVQNKETKIMCGLLIITLLIGTLFIHKSIGHHPSISQVWNVIEGGELCIMAKFTAEILIQYKDSNNLQRSTMLNISSDAHVDVKQSKCKTDNDTQIMVLKFINDTDTKVGILTLIFEKIYYEYEDYINVKSIKLSLNLTHDLFPYYPDPTKFGTYVEMSNNDVRMPEIMVAVAQHTSYYCEIHNTIFSINSQIHFNLAQIKFFNIQIEAFIEADPLKPRDFGPVIDCKIVDGNEIAINVILIIFGSTILIIIIYKCIIYIIRTNSYQQLD
jgi:hypothetical protein